MISDLKKLTDGLIIFSALYSEFEKLDFKNDALAGVRSNYFNSHNTEQNDVTEVCIDSDIYGLSYKMSINKPLLWKVSRNNRPYQSVKKLSDGIYSVLYYEENGIISKRVYFDGNHNWLRTEYFDKQNETKLTARLFPKNISGIIALVLERFANDSTTDPITLFPSDNPKGKRCTALIYSNVGMLWYDEVFCPEDLKYSTKAECTSSGFEFTVQSFNSDDTAEMCDITKANYLDKRDIPAENSPHSVAEMEYADNNINYSAYDKIEKILAEAHKSNKDLFGEIINHAGNVFDEPDVEDISEENEENPEQSTVPILSETDNSESFSCKISSDKVNTDASDNEQQDNSLKELFNKPVPIKSGKYYYYGSLSKSGERTGKGRTVSNEGITLYEGEYCEDKRQGFGVSYYKNGSINYFGNWADNARSGCGTGFRRSDGTLHTGNWINNTPQGYGARFASNGEFIDLSSYQNGVKHGKSISFDENGNVIISIWENGVKISEKLIED